LADGLKLKIGSRGSQLALWQANHIAESLRTKGHDIEVEIIHTTGDKIIDVPLAKVGAKGMFTKEIEEALADRRIDLAVHSLKDLPTDLGDKFKIGAIPMRDDPRDALCSKLYSSLEDLPRGARVGTSSLRREAQLKALRPDLVVHPLRGNVDTRLRKLELGEYDAIILAAAGLNRLGKIESIRQIFGVGMMCPAAGQGALAIEIRAGDTSIRDALSFLDDPGTQAETSCERALLQSLGGGCQVPIGANAKLRDGVLHLEAVVASPDGKALLRESLVGTHPVTLAESTAEKLLSRGGRAVLDSVYGQSVPLPQQP
jgi:hydroxymethylbilane synthase